jgi:hypothetical protein
MINILKVNFKEKQRLAESIQYKLAFTDKQTTDCADAK